MAITWGKGVANLKIPKEKRGPEITGRRHRFERLAEPRQPVRASRRGAGGGRVEDLSVRAHGPCLPRELAANAATSRSEARGRKETAPRRKGASLWRGIYNGKKSAT